MIVRIWHGRTKTEDAETYRKFVIESGISEYLAVKGNLGAQVWQKQEGNITHVWTVSWWDDYDSIRAFAGEPLDTAKYYEEDKKFLLEFEPTVSHSECYDFRK